MQEEAMLNFKWESFSSQLTNSLDTCFVNQHFVDLSLVCKSGTVIKCHKMVLSNASSFFRRLLVKNEHPHPMIILHDIEADDLKTIVNFMYCGEIQVVKSEVGRILKIAETLEVSGLKDIRNTISLPETNNFDPKNPRLSADTECPSKKFVPRSLPKKNMAVDTSNTTTSFFRIRGPSESNIFSSFDERNNEAEKVTESPPKSQYNLRKSTINSRYENNVGTYGPSTSKVTSERFNVADTNEKSSRKRMSTEGEITWNKVLSEISKEDQMPAKRHCLIDEIEITAHTPRTEALSKGDELRDNITASSCLSPEEEPAFTDCGILIKDELDISSDSECESNTAATETYDCAEHDTLTIDPPGEIFKRVHCISGNISVSPKHISLFELLKSRGSNR